MFDVIKTSRQSSLSSSDEDLSLVSQRRSDEPPRETPTTSTFFKSKKIKPRRQHESGKVESTENVESRLQKVKELFDIIKLSRNQKNQKESKPQRKSRIPSKETRQENRKTTKRKSSIHDNSVAGDNHNDVVIEALTNKDQRERQRKEALKNLLKIAGNDWVKNNIY